MAKNLQYKMMAEGPKSREAPKMPEIPVVPESQPEVVPDVVPSVPEKPQELTSPSLLQSAPKAPQPASKETILLEIENILSEGLTEVYKRMPPELQGEFRAEGERVASRIRVILEQAKFKIQDVIKMIRKWLGMIPGVNKFFLEQEAKIKTDKVVELAERNKK